MGEAGVAKAGECSGRTPKWSLHVQSAEGGLCRPPTKTLSIRGGGRTLSADSLLSARQGVEAEEEATTPCLAWIGYLSAFRFPDIGKGRFAAKSFVARNLGPVLRTQHRGSSSYSWDDGGGQAPFSARDRSWLHAWGMAGPPSAFVWHGWRAFLSSLVLAKTEDIVQEAIEHYAVSQEEREQEAGLGPEEQEARRGKRLAEALDQYFAVDVNVVATLAQGEGPKVDTCFGRG